MYNAIDYVDFGRLGTIYVNHYATMRNVPIFKQVDTSLNIHVKIAKTKKKIIIPTQIYDRITEMVGEER